MASVLVNVHSCSNTRDIVTAAAVSTWLCMTAATGVLQGLLCMLWPRFLLQFSNVHQPAS